MESSEIWVKDSQSKHASTAINREDPRHLEEYDKSTDQ